MSIRNEFTLKVYGLIVGDGKLLATFHDQGFGTFTGLPGEYVKPGDSIRGTVGRAVYEQTSMNIQTGQLLAVDYSVYKVFRLEKPDTPINQIDMVFECVLKSTGTPKLSDSEDISDGSITGCGWMNIENFLNDIPSSARNLWIRAILIQQGKEKPDLHENDVQTVMI